MKKISTLFVIDRENDIITNVVRPENQWVLDGEGFASIKFDGTSCYFKNGQLYRRFDKKLTKFWYIERQKALKKHKSFVPKLHMFRTLPEGAIACNETFDPVTYHWPHWIPVSENNPADQFHIEGWKNFQGNLEDDQTYELVGPSFATNPYGLNQHELWKHGSIVVEIKDRSFEALKELILSMNEEGLIFTHSDGRMCKLRRGDFLKPRKTDDFWHWKDAKREEFI